MIYVENVTDFILGVSISSVLSLVNILSANTILANPTRVAEKV